MLLLKAASPCFWYMSYLFSHMTSVIFFSSHLSLITLQESLYSIFYSKYYFHAIITVICVSILYSCTLQHFNALTTNLSCALCMVNKMHVLHRQSLSLVHFFLSFGRKIILFLAEHALGVGSLVQIEPRQIKWQFEVGLQQITAKIYNKALLGQNSNKQRETRWKDDKWHKDRLNNGRDLTYPSVQNNCICPPPPSPNLRSELANKTGVTKSVASSAVASVMGYGSNDRPISIKLTITT